MLTFEWTIASARDLSRLARDALHWTENPSILNAESEKPPTIFGSPTVPSMESLLDGTITEVLRIVEMCLTWGNVSPKVSTQCHEI